MGLLVYVNFMDYCLLDGVMSSNKGLMSKEQFARALPKRLKSTLSDGLLVDINKVINDSTLHEGYRDNLLSYTSVLQDGKFKIDDYVHAVRYISYKLMGSSNIDAYCKAFPDRYQKFIDDGVSDKNIASYISSYNKNKLVNLIFAQTLVPSYVLNSDLYQRALNVSADLMLTAKSEKVRCDAANNLLGHLKMPDEQKVELDISIKEDSVLRDLRKATSALVMEQRRVLELGASTVTKIAHSSIVSNIEEGELVEV